jgi:hypothetical protein
VDGWMDGRVERQCKRFNGLMMKNRAAGDRRNTIGQRLEESRGRDLR